MAITEKTRGRISSRVHFLTRFLGLMTSRRTVVEEALNDTMLVVWKRSHTYNGQSKVSTWLFAIASATFGSFCLPRIFSAHGTT